MKTKGNSQWLLRQSYHLLLRLLALLLQALLCEPARFFVVVTKLHSLLDPFGGVNDDANKAIDLNLFACTVGFFMASSIDKAYIPAMLAGTNHNRV